MSILLTVLGGILGYQFACMQNGIYGTTKIHIKGKDRNMELLDGHNTRIKGLPKISHGMIYNNAIFCGSMDNHPFTWSSIRPFEIINDE